TGVGESAYSRLVKAYDHYIKSLSVVEQTKDALPASTSFSRTAFDPLLSDDELIQDEDVERQLNRTHLVRTCETPISRPVVQPRTQLSCAEVRLHAAIEEVLSNEKGVVRQEFLPLLRTQNGLQGESLIIPATSISTARTLHFHIKLNMIAK